MRAVLCFLVMLMMVQPAQACALDGFLGAHRFNPFAGMELDIGSEDSDETADSYETSDDLADDAALNDGSVDSDIEQENAELNPDDYTHS